MDFNQMQDAIKSAFCSLVKFKAHGEKVLEVITPFHTVNSKAVSVFLTTQGEKLVATDGGWLAEADAEYATPNSLDSITAEASRFIEMLSESFSVKKTTGAQLHYYRTTLHLQEVPAMVYDLANFLMGAINMLCFEAERGTSNRMLFQQGAREFISAHFGDDAKFNVPISDSINVPFDVVIKRAGALSLVEYVTGSNSNHFKGDIGKTKLNFEILNAYNSDKVFFKRFVLYNDLAGGYNKDEVAPYMHLLSQQLSKRPISWSKKGKLIEAIEAES